MKDNQPSDNWRDKPINFHAPNEVEHAALWLGFFAFLIIAVGFVYVTHADEPEHGSIRHLISELYANGGSELFSIAITVLIVERLNNRRSKRDAAEHEKQIAAEAEAREKADLILQMGSPDNGFAREAVRKLRARGWLTDGSLQGVELWGANLLGAILQEANLSEAILYRANLSETDLSVSNLSGGDLRGTNLSKSIMYGTNLFRAKLYSVNLSGAYLSGVDLSGAELQDVNLSDTYLSTTKFDEDTILPNGSKWTPETDMSRFTDPDHPDFWEPDWVKQQRQQGEGE